MILEDVMDEMIENICYITLQTKVNNLRKDAMK